MPALAEVATLPPQGPDPADRTIACAHCQLRFQVTSLASSRWKRRRGGEADVGRAG